MDIIRGNHFSRSRLSAAFALAWLATAIVLCPASAQNSPPPAPQAKPADDDFLGKIGRWFDEQSAKFNSNFDSGLKGAKEKIDTFGHEAGVAAKATADTAKGGIEAVGRLTNTHTVRGHEKCVLAANGAPDCVAAANIMCKAQGYSTGKSLDMTTAEDCPPQVWLSGRTADNQCKPVTFVSRAVCQ